MNLEAAAKEICRYMAPHIPGLTNEQAVVEILRRHFSAGEVLMKGRPCYIIPTCIDETRPDNRWMICNLPVEVDGDDCRFLDNTGEWLESGAGDWPTKEAAAQFLASIASQPAALITRETDKFGCPKNDGGRGPHDFNDLDNNGRVICAHCRLPEAAFPDTHASQPAEQGEQCPTCRGTGLNHTGATLGHTDGIRYFQCSRCGGTGSLKSRPAESATPAQAEQDLRTHDEMPPGEYWVSREGDDYVLNYKHDAGGGSENVSSNRLAATLLLYWVRWIAHEEAVDYYKQQNAAAPPAQGVERPEPKPPLSAIGDAAGLCESESSRRESLEPQTARHWKLCAKELRAYMDRVAKVELAGERVDQETMNLPIRAVPADGERHVIAQVRSIESEPPSPTSPCLRRSHRKAARESEIQMNPLTPELERLYSNATPGEWYPSVGGVNSKHLDDDETPTDVCSLKWTGAKTKQQRDKVFICESHNAFSALLAAARRERELELLLRKAISKLELEGGNDEFVEHVRAALESK